MDDPERASRALAKRSSFASGRRGTNHLLSNAERSPPRIMRGQDDTGLNRGPRQPGPDPAASRGATRFVLEGILAIDQGGPSQMSEHAIDVPVPGKGRAAEVFIAFLRLGLSSFGGPIAHLGYFRQEFVARRRWLDEAAYADLVALCQFLPGPASSEVGIGIGLHPRRASPARSPAWTGFTLPSAIALVLFALGVERPGRDRRGLAARPEDRGGRGGRAGGVGHGEHHGDRQDAGDACGRRGGRWSLAVPTTAGQLGAIALGALAGVVLLRTERPPAPPAADAPDPPCALPSPASPSFFALLIGLPLLHGRVSQPGAGAVRRLLPRRRAGVRRRPCGAAAAAGGRGAAGLGHQRRLPRRLWRRAGGARGRCSPSPPISAR